jgi:DNA-binding transcriptional MerR regulator
MSNRDGLFTIGDIAKRTQLSRATVDRYERLRLIEPASEDTSSLKARYFDESTVKRIDLIKKLQKKPFRLLLEDVKNLFDNISIEVLVDLSLKSDKEMFNYLSDNKFL